VTRRRALCASAAFVLALSLPQRASAVLGVGDITFDPTAYDQAVLAYKQLQEQYDELTKATNFARRQLASIQRVTNIPNELRAEFDSIRTPILGDINAISDLLAGRGGTISGLSDVLSRISSRNRVYRNPGTDFWATEQNRRADSIAGQQSVAEELIRQANIRIPLLQSLSDRLRTSADPAEKQDLIARLGAEQTQLANLTVQANAVRDFAQAEQASFEQRRKEQIQMEIDDAVASLEADRQARFR